MKIRGKIYSTFIIFFAVLGMIAAVPAFADNIGSISFTDGRVDILKAGQGRALSVESGASIAAGDIIRTKSNARAEITLSDGTVLRLARSSRLGVNNLSSLNLMRGRMRTIIPEGNAGLEVTTPNGKAQANGTDFYFLHQKGSSWFYGSSGTMQVSGKNDPDSVVSIADLNCVRLASGNIMQDSCVFKDVDVRKFAWDTSTTEKTPVIAKLPTEEGVYTYTPLGGVVIDTPSMPVTIQNQDLVCTQCPPEGVPVEKVEIVEIVEKKITKIGYFTREDDGCPSCKPEYRD